MKMGKLAVAILMAFGIQGASSGSARAVSFFDGNGYDIVLVGTDWNTARSAALGMSYLGTNGHLATITSQAENDFLYDLVTSVTARPAGFSGAWLGGASNQWVDGPDAGTDIAPGSGNFTNWGGVEPNNFPNFIYMHIGGDPHPSGIGTGDWVDSGSATPSGGDPVIGYFVEYEGVAPVPVPAALPLAAGGLGVVGLLGWRRRRMAVAA